MKAFVVIMYWRGQTKYSYGRAVDTIISIHSTKQKALLAIQKLVKAKETSKNDYCVREYMID